MSTAAARVEDSPQLTVRSIVTGMVIGAILTPCNVYSGLKIGWSFNMSIAAALISFAFWKGATRAWGAPAWGILENNLNQTSASAAASIVSAGLVAPIPALTMLTGRSLTYPLLAAWVLIVSLLGVIVGVGLRRQMLVRDRLPFPAGIATAETLREIHTHGREALRRVQVLLGAGALSAGLKLVNDFVTAIPRLPLPFSMVAGARLQAAGITSISAANLGFVLDPSLLMIGFGAIIGLRTGVSLLLGAIVAWGVLGPRALALGWAAPGAAGAHAFWFAPMVKWLLWPGVTLMVVAALTSLALSLHRIVRARHPGDARQAAPAEARANAPRAQVPVGWFVGGLLVVLVLGVIAQQRLFGIGVVTGAIAVMLSFLLAVVAARVSGETGITPIGAMGKITQLSFAVISPANVTSNLMAANVTGGAAGQCADLMHDLKTGLLLGAQPRLQALAQVFGVLTGSVVGAGAYIALVPNPARMLITPQWPAPAVATWKAVAEVLRGGLAHLPPAAVPAMAIAAAAGLLLSTAHHFAPRRWSHLVPSASAIGLAFVIPAWNSVSLFIGAVLAYTVTRLSRSWSERFLLAAAAGLVAGESLAGVATAMGRLFFS